MSFFKKLFGGNKPKETATPPRLSAAAGDPAKDPNMMRVYDAYGREMFISRHEWRTNVLPGTIEANWNKPNELYGVILGALNDGFRADVVAAAEQLFQIDHLRDRGTCVWGIVLMEEGQLDQAEKVFRDFISKHGENGSVLTNLAKVYARRNDNAKAEEVLWRALEADPNQDNGMGWYWIIHKERGGEAAGDAALRRVAAIPKSWRARLWLARSALEKRDLDGALAFYQEAMDLVGQPAPADLLMQISGDLGNTGHLPQILQLVGPRFVPEVHGMEVGNNLIKANLDLGQLDVARRILDQLYAQKRIDWKDNLSFWDTEIAKARVSTVPQPQQGPLSVALLSIEGPIWLKPFSPAAELFPAKFPDGVVVSFIGSTAEVITNSRRTQHQLADTRGRLTRSVPLYLAEQVEFGSNARVQTLIPWIAQEPGGFVLSGVAWEDVAAANHARQGTVKSDYVVITHLKPNAEPWTVELRLVQTIDATCLGTFSVSFPSANPEQGIPTLALQLLTFLSEQTDVERVSPPAVYQVPSGPYFGNYLLRLEQLLAVRCGAMEGRKESFLNGEREIVDGNLQLCVDFPESISARVLLAQTVSAMKKARPGILPEFKEKIALLQKEKPLPEPAQGVVQRMFHEVLSA